MRKWTFILFTALHALTGPCLALGQDKSVPVETIERIKSATAPIVCGAPRVDRSSFHISRNLGTAFFINGEGYFLTAAHVVTALEQFNASQSQCFPAIYMPIGGWRTTGGVHWFRFGECVKDPEADIAVCKPTTSPFAAEDVKRQLTFVAFGTALNVKDGTALAFTGFPLQFLRPVTSKGNLAAYLDLDKKIVIDKAAWGGASGSPVYLADGSVIGILIERGTGESIGLALARPAEFITDFLTKNKIQFSQQKQKQK